MDSIRKKASKLRDQVAKQQQAVFKQFTNRYDVDTDTTSLLNEEEQECYHKLQTLFASTKAAKHLQRDVARGLEAFLAISYKQMEIVKKVAEDCYNYGEEHKGSAFELARASVEFGNTHGVMENERDILLRDLGVRVFEPLRAMLTSPSLEDARLLTYHHERIRQDVEAQAAEVIRRQLKSMDTNATPEILAKLEHSESKLLELRKSLSALGTEACAAMATIEAQQQHVTFECLVEMVDAERAYHHNVACLLHKLHDVMAQAKQRNASLRQNETSKPIELEAVKEDVASLLNDFSSNGGNHTHFVQAKQHNESMKHNEISKPIKLEVVKEDVASQPNDFSSNGGNHTHFVQAEQHNEPMRQNETSEPIKLEAAKEDVVSQPNEFSSNNGNHTHFLAEVDWDNGDEVVHSFDAQAEEELSLSVGDYVVVRQVALNGWSEGELKGQAGWFPSTYVEQCEKALASKVIESQLLT